jgi:hypothetical protein
MDEVQLMMALFRKEFGNLLNVARIKIVTVLSVDLTNNLATIEFARGDVTDDDPPQQVVNWFDSYIPQVGDKAYMMNTEGAPVLIGVKETETWHNLTLPSGYTSASPFRLPAYRKDNQGRVWFKGIFNIAPSNAIGVKFTMPAGYRPLTKTWIAAWCSNGAAITSTFPGMRFDVNTDGTIETLVASPSVTQIFSLEGASYDTRP